MPARAPWGTLRRRSAALLGAAFLVCGGLLAEVDRSRAAEQGDAPSAQEAAPQKTDELQELQKKLDALSEAAERQLTTATARGADVARLAEAIDRLLSLLTELRASNARLRAERATLSDELARSRTETEILLTRGRELEDARASLEVSLRESESERGDQSGRIDRLGLDLASERERGRALATALNEALAAAQQAEGTLQERDAQLRALTEELQQTRTALNDQAQESAETDERVTLLRQQLDELQTKLTLITQALAASDTTVSEQDARIVDLESKLQEALARRLEELESYRSEFFGRLRAVLGSRAGVRVVGDRFVLQSDVLFDPGSAELSDAAMASLSTLAETLSTIAAEIPTDLEWILRVDGHTDRVPINTPTYPSNWDLSAARAVAVVNFLITRGIPPEHLAAAGFGQHHPIDPRDDEIAYRRNRRIELRLTAR